MEWETYNTKKIEEKYVYRYMTIEKLIDFLKTGEIYLARLDTFEDNLESITPYDITELAMAMKKLPEDPNPAISQDMWQSIIEQNKGMLEMIKAELWKKQHTTFVSCWILSDVESFAMWDIYGKSGFAIRFERKYFQQLIKNSTSIQDFSITETIDKLVVGKVKYQNFNDVIENEQKSTLKYSAFRKHLSFNHESEYRIVGYTNTAKDIKGLRLKLHLPLENIDFDILANPRLSSFQFEQYKDIISKYPTSKTLQESELKKWLELRNMTLD